MEFNTFGALRPRASPRSGLGDALGSSLEVEEKKGAVHRFTYTLSCISPLCSPRSVSDCCCLKSLRFGHFQR